MAFFDSFIEKRAREIARRTDRRRFLGRLGQILVGGAALPLLPISRAAAQSQPNPRVPAPAENIEGPEGDETSCEYWRQTSQRLQESLQRQRLGWLARSGPF